MLDGNLKDYSSATGWEIVGGLVCVGGGGEECGVNGLDCAFGIWEILNFCFIWECE